MSQEVEGPSNPVVLFRENERVLCHHQQLIYEGKVLAVKKQFMADTEEEEVFYRIHYAGWSKKWDEYVPASRLLKYSEENLNLQKELKAKKDAASPRTGRKSTLASGKSMGSANRKTSSQAAGDSLKQFDMDASAPSTPTNTHADEHTGSTDKGKRRATHPKSKLPSKWHITEPQKPLDEAEFEVLIPDKIKQILLEDYDRIRRQKMLLTVIGRHTISSVLSGFLDHLKEKTTEHVRYAQVIEDNITFGLYTRLLYREELEQFHTVIQHLEEGQRPDHDPKYDNFQLLSRIYGPYHLMRLCSNIGRILNSTAEVEDVPVDTFKEFLRSLYEYVVSRSDDLFIPDLDYLPVIVPQ